MIAPIVQDFSRKGYYYTDDAFELPRLPVTQDEVLAVLIARRLLVGAGGGFMSEAMHGFVRKLQSTTTAFGLDEDHLE